MINFINSEPCICLSVLRGFLLNLQCTWITVAGCALKKRQTICTSDSSSEFFSVLSIISMTISLIGQFWNRRRHQLRLAANRRWPIPVLDKCCFFCIYSCLYHFRQFSHAKSSELKIWWNLEWMQSLFSLKHLGLCAWAVSFYGLMALVTILSQKLPLINLVDIDIFFHLSMASLILLQKYWSAGVYSIYIDIVYECLTF